MNIVKMSSFILYRMGKHKQPRYFCFFCVSSLDRAGPLLIYDATAIA